MEGNQIQLRPIIKEHDHLFLEIEKRIIKVFQTEIYRPLIHVLASQMGVKRRKISNSSENLKDALDSGRITYSRGAFRGKFNTYLTKELKAIGAVWDAKTSSFKLKMEEIPYALQIVIGSSSVAFTGKLAVLAKVLSQVDPEKISEKIFVEAPIRATLDEVDDTFRKSIKAIPKPSRKRRKGSNPNLPIASPSIPPSPSPLGITEGFKNPYDAVMEKAFGNTGVSQKTPQGITVSPKLTKEQRAEIASEYQDNIRRSIKGFSIEQVKSLREKIELSARAGNRYESLIKVLETEYGLTTSRAKFIARQETNLFLASFKKARYTSVGSEKYIWGCVKMPHDTSPDHHTLGNVRYYHGILEGSTQRWDNPPPTDAKGNKNNPLEDYNCRCFAIPLIEF